MTLTVEQKAALYEACRASAVAMGDKLKTISWFGRAALAEHRRGK